MVGVGENSDESGISEGKVMCRLRGMIDPRAYESCMRVALYQNIDSS